MRCVLRETCGISANEGPALAFPAWRQVMMGVAFGRVVMAMVTDGNPTGRLQHTYPKEFRRDVAAFVTNRIGDAVDLDATTAAMPSSNSRSET